MFSSLLQESVEMKTDIQQRGWLKYIPSLCQNVCIKDTKVDFISNSTERPQFRQESFLQHDEYSNSSRLHCSPEKFPDNFK